jgi:predicted negative regulator of RcsB-dependent stress response
MKNLKRVVALSLIVVATGDLIGAVGGVIKIGKRGPQKVYSIVGQADGSVSVKYKQGQPTQTLRKGTYRVVSMEVPSSTFKKAKLLLQKKLYSKAAKEAKTLFDSYKWLGYGALPGVICAKALLAQEKFSEAEKVCEENLKLNGSNKDLGAEMALDLAQAYAGQGKSKELILLIPNLIKAGGVAAAYAFNVQGDIAKKAKDNEGALLAYMKTFTLFPADDESVSAYRAVAKKNIIELFTLMGDTRAKTFVNEK